jgi:hypothetical protein
MTAEDLKDMKRPPLGKILLEWKENGKTKRVILDCSMTEHGGELTVRRLDRCSRRKIAPEDGGNDGHPPDSALTCSRQAARNQLRKPRPERESADRESADLKGGSVPDEQWPEDREAFDRKA